jgi:RND family efflux transporter MFP subunit
MMMMGGPLSIRKIAAHGSRVRKGELLIALDTRRIDQTIRDMEIDMKVSEASLKLAEEDLPYFQKSMPVELEAATRAHKQAEEDLNYFLEVGRPQAEKDADFSLKTAAFFLEYAREELRQLEKMYKANDLTEETEQIVLRRQKHAVERAVFSHKSAVIAHEHTFKVTLPRKEKALREGLVKQTLQLEKTRATLPVQADQKRETLVKLRHDRAKAVAQLERLRHDRAAMSVTAPVDGIVYHGKFHKGQWTLSEALGAKLAVEGSIMPGEVFLTVVKARPLALRLTVDEKDIHLLKPGLKGKARVVFDPKRKLTARLTAVSPVPAAPGKYEVQAVLEGEGEAGLMPGMGCTLRFVPYESKDALVVPAGAVAEEDDRHFVTVVSADGKKERREVTTGHTHRGQTEILSGLREGEEILATAAKGGEE